MRLLNSATLLSVSLIIAITGCSHTPTSNDELKEYKTIKLDQPQQQEIGLPLKPLKASSLEGSNSLTFDKLPLRSGQIIVSDTDTALNFFVSLTDPVYNPYAHAGVISIEDGEPYLYHAVPNLNLLYSGTLTDKTQGTIERWHLSKFLRDRSIAAIYSSPSQKQERAIAEFAVNAFKNKLPYDSLFDETDSSKVYCSEFVVQAIESSNISKVKLRPRNRHTSIDAVYEGLGILSVDHYFASDLVEGFERIALFSRQLTMKQIDIYFALKNELHQRFTPKQKVGNIMSWTGTGLEFRPSVKHFLKRGIDGGFRKQGQNETLNEWVSALADEVLGRAKN